MKLLDYIKGKRKGRDAHRIEKDSMKDPFLYEALEGFDSVNDNHIERIYSLQKRLQAKSKPEPVMNRIMQIAAVFAVLVFGLASYLFIDYHKSELQAQNLNRSSIIEVYVPEPFYEENITVVAKTNVELAKAYKPTISQFKADVDISDKLSDKEIEILQQEEANKSPIEIYVPENYEESSNPE